MYQYPNIRQDLMEDILINDFSIRQENNYYRAFQDTQNSGLEVLRGIIELSLTEYCAYSIVFYEEQYYFFRWRMDNINDKLNTSINEGYLIEPIHQDIASFIMRVKHTFKSCNKKNTQEVHDRINRIYENIKTNSN